jgi:hypothetical protein
MMISTTIRLTTEILDNKRRHGATYPLSNMNCQYERFRTASLVVLRRKLRLEDREQTVPHIYVGSKVNGGK